MSTISCATKINVAIRSYCVIKQILLKIYKNLIHSECQFVHRSSNAYRHFARLAITRRRVGFRQERGSSRQHIKIEKLKKKACQACIRDPRFVS
jgi:hypothetical protein